MKQISVHSLEKSWLKYISLQLWNRDIRPFDGLDVSLSKLVFLHMTTVLKYSFLKWQSDRLHRDDGVFLWCNSAKKKGLKGDGGNGGSVLKKIISRANEQFSFRQVKWVLVYHFIQKEGKCTKQPYENNISKMFSDFFVSICDIWVFCLCVILIRCLLISLNLNSWIVPK